MNRIDVLNKIANAEEYLVFALDQVERQVTITKGDKIEAAVVLERHVVSDIREVFREFHRLLAVVTTP